MYFSIMILKLSESGFDMFVYLDSVAQKILHSFGYEAFHYPLQAATSFYYLQIV